MIKSYISLNYLHLTTTIVVDDLYVVVEFKGGRLTPQRMNGRFTTTSECLQKAIENDSGYGKEFILIENINKNEFKDQTTEHKSRYKQIGGVKNRQMAIEWVLKKFNVELPKNISYNNIKKYVNERGFDFHQWQ